jgi:hypothetical protein
VFVEDESLDLMKEPQRFLEACSRERYARLSAAFSTVGAGGSIRGLSAGERRAKVPPTT